MASPLNASGQFFLTLIVMCLLAFSSGCDDSTGVTNTLPDTNLPDVPDLGDGCDCEDDEQCVTNATVTNACYSADCPDAPCGADEVCFDGACVPVSCAGLDCGGFPNVCRSGECVVGSCADADVMCPADQVCVGDLCVDSCADQSDCTPMACVDEYCQPCSGSEQCGDDANGDPLICDAESCVTPCTEDPSRCASDQVCDPTDGRCVERCTSDDFCPGEQICGPDTGECGAPECTMPGTQGECGQGEVCLNGRCEGRNSPITGTFASGVAEMTSATHRLIGVLSPVEVIGGEGSELTSDTHRLEAGALRVLSADE